MNKKSLALSIEMCANIAVVLSLILLIIGINKNTTAVKKQTELQRSEATLSPFFDPNILLSAYSKIKQVDGQEPAIAALQEYYKLTDKEAILWSRFLYRIWMQMQISYLAEGPSKELENNIYFLANIKDNQILLENSKFDDKFENYIEQVLAKAH